MRKIVYHGWVVREPGGAGFKDSFHAEWTDAEGKRHRGPIHYSPVPVLEFWDKKVGKPVRLLPAPLGAYRVYTKEPQ